ncbi:MAG TPA: hypothetical protein VNF27_14235, partial [Candidatus Binataceae bacterium]|nr:hypothetical protein [Candidatus Binataceae bacterium]
MDTGASDTGSIAAIIRVCPPEPPSLLRVMTGSSFSPSKSAGAPGRIRLNDAPARFIVRLSAAKVPQILRGAIAITAAPLRSAARA